MGSPKCNGPQFLYVFSHFSPFCFPCSQGGEQRWNLRGGKLFPVALYQENINSVIKEHAQKWKYLAKPSEL